MRDEIVVGLDASASGMAALDWAARQAKSAGAALRAVHVLDWPYGLSAAGFPAPIDFTELTREEIEDSYRRAITAVFDAVAPSPDWILQFASGNTGQVLVQQSKDARLLVVGTREHIGLGRLLTGSVSHYCLSHAECPVVGVPATPTDQSAEESESAERDDAVGLEEGMTAVIEAEETVLDEPEAPSTALIVAGVDASTESLAAAQYAVAAAEMRRGDVVLVHAFKPSSAWGGNKDVASSAARTTAEKLLAAVRAQLIIPPQVQVRINAVPGSAVAILEEAASTAEMLVLGRDRVSWGERLFMGAVTSRIVNHIECPLIVVPGRWRPRQAWPPLPVMVALDTETDPEPALRLAFQEARLRETRLIVLHAEPMRASARDRDAVQFDLGVALADWKQDHPEVGVSTVIVTGDPDAQLVRWSRSAAVLVVGHPHRRGWGEWTGSVTRSVMKQTHCPLMVAPEPTADRGRHRELASQALT
jgi:nucleotide-binding universal stress UspA family protein